MKIVQKYIKDIKKKEKDTTQLKLILPIKTITDLTPFTTIGNTKYFQHIQTPPYICYKIITILQT